jgi:hypothetical protein
MKITLIALFWIFASLQLQAQSLGTVVKKLTLREAWVSEIYCATIRPSLSFEETVIFAPKEQLLTISRIKECLSGLPKEFQSLEKESGSTFFLVGPFFARVGETSCSLAVPLGRNESFSITFLPTTVLVQSEIKECFQKIRIMMHENKEPVNGRNPYT